MHKALSRTLWGVAFVGGLTVLGAGAANAADTSGEDGIASGTQVAILGELPVTVSGNALSILGDSESSSAPATPAASGDSTPAAATTSGEGGIASGNQVAPDATVPVTVTGNSISVIGDSSTAGTQPSTGPSDGADATSASTTGEDGIASGNQVMPDVNAPVLFSGNDISVIRDEAVLDGGLLDAVTREDGVLEISLLDNGMSDEGVLGDGVLSGGLDVALLEDVVRDGTNHVGVVRTMLSANPVVSSSVSEPAADDSSEAEPTLASPMFRSLGLSAFAPLAVDAVVDGDGAATDEAESGLEPLMATAAVSAAMMLAATGVEALPLIGGIVLMLGSGFALVATNRMARMVG